MDRSIFRQAAIERLSTPERLDQPVRITSTLAWLALASLLLLLVAGCLASFIIMAPEKVPGDGIIMSPTGILEVPFPSSGRLVEASVKTGDRVAPGSVVARIEQPELRRSLEEAEKEHRDLLAELHQVEDFQRQVAHAQDAADARRRRDLQQSLELIQRRLGFLVQRAAIDTELGSKRLITRAQVVDTKVAIGAAEEEYANVERQINDITLNATNTHIKNQRELLELNLKVDAAARRTAMVAARLEQAEKVVSSYGGVVVEFKHDVGELVQQGTALMTLLPDRPSGSAKDKPPEASLHVILFVPNTEGKKIAPGMTVEIMPSTVRREEHGFMFARVQHVAAIPATAEGMLHVLKNQQLVNALSAGGAPFAVEVELLRDPARPTGYLWSSARGPDTAITPGTVAHGEVWIRRLHLIEFAIPAMRRFFGTPS